MKNASMGRPVEEAKTAANAHGYSLLPGHLHVIFSLLLVGCATAPAPPQIVNVPVYVSCVKTTPIRPQYEFSSLALAATDGDKILALARDWPAGRAYEGELEAVIAGCR